MLHLRDMRVNQKLGLMMLICSLGFLVFSSFCYFSFSYVKVKGPIYQKIVMGKDLIADILPPPEYIIESYLLVMQMLDTDSKDELNNYIQRIRQLEKDYRIRHQVWVDSLPKGKMRVEMVVKTYRPALQFFKVLDERLIPALLNGDHDKALNLARHVLKPLYERHRRHIDTVVKLATQWNLENEKQSDRTVIWIACAMIGLGVTIIGLTVLIWRAIHKSFTPLLRTKAILAEISQGEGDLTQRINIASRDEIGELAGHFNTFIGKLQAIITKIKTTAGAVSQSSTGLQQVADSMSASSEESTAKTLVVSNATAEISANIAAVAKAMGESSQNMNIIASAIEEISVTVQNLAATSDQTSANVSHVDNLVSHISQNIGAVSDSSRDVSDSVNNVTAAVKEINISLNEISRSCERSILIAADAGAKAQDTGKIIAALDHSSKQIEKIIAVIDDIADQTNMLALNAAIEAAGSGEAGKGFAVVANEVKALAKQTAASTEEIGQQIETMRRNMEDAVQSMALITAVIQEITGITGAIAAAVTEQSATTGEILTAATKAAAKVSLITGEIGELASNSKQTAVNISEAATGIAAFARSTAELATAANEAARNMTNLSVRTQEVAHNSREAAQGADEIAANIHQIKNTSLQTMKGATDTAFAAKELAQLARELESEVSLFKT